MKMKMRYFSITVLFALLLAANTGYAQGGIFIMDEEEEFFDGRIGKCASDFGWPDHDQGWDIGPAPVGNGLLLLSVLGGAYLLGRRRKDE